MQRIDPIANERRWLANVLTGRVLPRPVETPEQIDALLDCAMGEGVVALAHERLSHDPDVSSALKNAFAAAARDAAVASLLREAECRRVLAVLQAAQIPVLLMKGSALAWWLYPSAHLRECCDTDLLFSSRAQAQEAVRVLAAHSYALHHKPDDLSYELLCRREVGSMRFDLDMHWRLVNAPLFAESFGFAALEAFAIPLPRLAPSARGLGPVHAFLHACIHRAMNVSIGIGDGLKWLYDLHLLGQRMTAQEWSALQLQCREHQLSGICVAGIAAAADLFGAVVPETVLRSLQEAGAHETLDVSRLQDWKYMQARNLAALPSLRVRVRWLWQRVFPPTGYLRVLYGSDRGAASLWIQRMRHAIGRLRS